MSVTIRYFVAEGDRAEQIAKAGLDKANEIQRKRTEFCGRTGADGLYGHRCQTPSAVLFVGDGAEKKKDGFLAPEPIWDGKKKYFAHRPDRRTRAGKAILEELRRLAEFDFSDFIVKAFGVEHSTIGASANSPHGSSMFMSVAGYMNKKIVFKIPFGGDQGGGHRMDPAIPPELREIKKSEFIALTEEQPAEVDS